MKDANRLAFCPPARGWCPRSSRSALSSVWNSRTISTARPAVPANPDHRVLVGRVDLRCPAGRSRCPSWRGDPGHHQPHRRTDWRRWSCRAERPRLGIARTVEHAGIVFSQEVDEGRPGAQEIGGQTGSLCHWPPASVRNWRRTPRRSPRARRRSHRGWSRHRRRSPLSVAAAASSSPSTTSSVCLLVAGRCLCC